MAAFDPVPAGAAERERRIAPPVEEQQRLLAGLQRAPEHRRLQRRGEPLPARGRAAAQVDQRHLRQRRPPVALREPEPAVAPGIGVLLAFERRRGGGEHDRHVLQPGAQHRHVAGVVGDAVLLLEGGLMLLVHHDGAEFGEGQEQRRTRADHHPRPALRHRPPAAAPLAGRQVRVPGERPRAEPRLEALHPLRRQRDLRQQDERLPAAPERGRDRLEIDLRLARPRDALQQRHGEAGAPEPRRRRRLFVRQIDAPAVRVRRDKDRPRRQRHWPDRAQRRKALEDARPRPGLTGDFGGCERAAARQQLQHEPALRRRAHGRRRDIGQPPGAARLRRLQRRRHAQRHAQHGARRRERVVRHPRDEAAERRAHRRNVEAPRHGLQAVRRDAAGLPVPDHAGHEAAAERHFHDVARLEPLAGIVVGAGQRQGQQDRHGYGAVRGGHV